MNAPTYQGGPVWHADLTLGTAEWLTVITAAGAAPSLHNTQPWRFVLRPDAVELHLDQRRLLPIADPTGREARLSCGAALLNLRIAMGAAGVEPLVALLPQRSHPTLLAIVRPGGRRAATQSEILLHRAIPHRHSHREPFRPVPIPKVALSNMVYAGGVEGGYLRMLTDPPAVSAVAALVRRAEHLQQRDAAYQDELAKWIFTGGPRADGVPLAVSGPRPEPADLAGLADLPAVRDFAASTVQPTRHAEPDPLHGVLLSAGDTPLDQLRSGHALQRALLTATQHGVAASIISAPTELPQARAALRRQLGNAMWPQLVLRFGCAVPTAPTPRRPVSDIVELVTADHQTARR